MCSKVGLPGGPSDPTSICVEGLGPLPGFPKEPRRVPGFNSFADKCTLPELGDLLAQDKELGAHRLPRKSSGTFQGCGQPRTTWSHSLVGLRLQDSCVPRPTGQAVKGR